MYKIGIDVTYLASCALRGVSPSVSAVVGMNLPNVFKMAKRHHMVAITYLGLAKAIETHPELNIDAELLEEWKREYHKAVQKTVTFELERESLCKFFNENNIWHLCLKGVVLQRYYPVLGMRQMSDNDILIDSKKCKLVKDYLVSNGYEVLSYGTGYDDTYRKGRLIFEIHRMLIYNKEKTRRGYEYYKNVKKRLVPAENGCEHFFTDEDYYVYFIFHSHKHFTNGGCGIRTLMDISVYLAQKEDSLHLGYLNSELSKLGIYEYEKMASALAKRLFSCNPESLYSPDNLTEEEREIFAYHVSSGTFGTQENRVSNMLNNMSKGNGVTRATRFKYVFERIFPKMEFYRVNYPRAYKFIIPIPFIWFFRLIKAIFNHKKYNSELKYVDKK